MDYEKLASEESVNRTAEALKKNGIEVMMVKDGKEALKKIKRLIPKGVSVMNGSSRTLEQIGFIDYLKLGEHGWKNFHKAIVDEKNPERQTILRKRALLSDYYLGSVHALAEIGEFLIASNTGSQLPHIVFSSQNIILVVSTKKIVPTLNDAMNRLVDYVVPQEDKRMMTEYKMHTMLSKIIIFRRENSVVGRKVMMILVKEDLGF